MDSNEDEEIGGSEVILNSDLLMCIRYAGPLKGKKVEKQHDTLAVDQDCYNEATKQNK